MAAVTSCPDACDHINLLHYSCEPSNKSAHAMINDPLNIVFFAVFSLNASFLCVSNFFLCQCDRSVFLNWQF